MLKGSVDSSLGDGIGEITFSSEKANALDSNLLKQLIKHIQQISNNPDCKALYLNSLGKSFCSGAYFEELKSIKSQSEAEEFFALFGLITVSLREAPQPVVIRMQGSAVGGGVGILASADLAFGLKESAVRLSEFEVGLGPFVISPILEAKIGGSRLMELAISASWKDSNWCLATGLLSEVRDSSDELDAEVKKALDKIKQFSSQNVTTFKKLISPSGLREAVASRAIKAAQALLRP